VSRYTTQHTTLAVNETLTFTTTELLRIRGAQVQTVSGGTITVQVQANGRDLFDDTVRPISGAAPQEVTHLYTIPAGSAVSTIVEATSGVPTGTANIIVNVEPFEVLPKPAIALIGRDRLRLSRRIEAQQIDAVRRSTIRVAGDQTEAGQGQVEQVRNRVGRNARSLVYPGRYAFRGGRR
jgi:hypothetical protein